MERSRTIRFLRFAVTALSLTACVLLMALWVRSRELWDSINFQLGPGQKYHVASCNGKLAACRLPNFGRNGKRLVDQFGGQLFHSGWHVWNTGPWARPVRSGGLIVFTTLTPMRASEPYIFPAASISNWILILITAIAAAVPWVDRLSFRFSLRTLLIATTLVAVGMGAIVLLS
jgi:hypothetical protein